VPWALSIASVLWNYWNYRRTTGLQKRIRVDTVRLEEFRRIRTGIDTVLTDLGSQRDTLRSLSSSGVTLGDLRKQVEEQQKKILEIYLRLESALQRADQSTYASGTDWFTTIEGHWDRFLDAVDKVYGPHRPQAEARRAPSTAAGFLGELITAVEARLDREMQQFVKVDS
jgi:hypothetical protein